MECMCGQYQAILTSSARIGRKRVVVAVLDTTCVTIVTTTDEIKATAAGDSVPSPSS